MGLVSYILAYLAVGYVIALLTAAVAPPDENETRVDVMTLVVTTCWGLIAIALAWRILCVPVLVIRRTRLRMTGQVNTNE